MVKKIIGAVFGAVGLALAAIAAAGFYVDRQPVEGFPILEYHKINDEDTDIYTVSTADFAAQLDYLRQEGYTAITVLEYLNARAGKGQLPVKPVLITFDDGYRDNYTNAVPMMEKRGLRGTIFIVTNDIGLDKYLTWDDLTDLQNRHSELGSHTANHIPLTELSDEKAEEEMKVTKLITTWHGLKKLFGFSYPNGLYKPEYAPLLKRNGYHCAVTGDPGLNTLRTKPYELHRINIPRPVFGLWEFRLRLLRAKMYTYFGIDQHNEE